VQNRNEILQQSGEFKSTKLLRVARMVTKPYHETQVYNKFQFNK